jgi:hypothetical protein
MQAAIAGAIYTYAYRLLSRGKKTVIAVDGVVDCHVECMVVQIRVKRY